MLQTLRLGKTLKKAGQVVLGTALVPLIRIGLDMVTQTGVTHEHTLSASGGTDKMKGYASIGYLDNEGTVKRAVLYSLYYKTEFGFEAY